MNLLNIALLIFAALSIGLLAREDSTNAHQASLSNWGTINMGEDSFYNWDFHTQPTSFDCPSACDKVDWPVSMLFWDDALINTVKVGLLDAIGGQSGASHSANYARLNDGSGWVWDGDGGIKNDNSCPSVGYHMRLYADGDDRLYNPILVLLCSWNNSQGGR